VVGGIPPDADGSFWNRASTRARRDAASLKAEKTSGLFIVSLSSNLLFSVEPVAGIHAKDVSAIDIEELIPSERRS
jgi:hypothetical protein